MAGIARRAPVHVTGAAAGAILASVASLAFLIALVAATSLDTLTALALPIGAAIAVAVGYAALLAFRTFRSGSQESVPAGRAFDLRSAIGFAVAVTVIEFGSAALAIVAALTTNQVTKVALAVSLGRGRYAAMVIVGLVLTLGAAWAGAVPGLLR